MIYLGADHAGFKLKQQIKNYLDKINQPYEDKGNLKLEKGDDYPDYGYKVAKAVARNKKAKGILICGSAFGVCIVANKIKGVRAVPVSSVKDAKLSREHNDANILCLAGGGMKKKIKGVGVDITEVKKIIKAWLNTPVSKAKRHHRRINKIKKIEKNG